ncbi:MAG: efflux RND transporter periplasmic adaptor subunit, partial [Candidatus Falkowbacteria bacterium]|nr:efflux RND transporter periplasmic adaptor subunit [Candidatus Falkowbacteria bacterium]
IMKKYFNFILILAITLTLSGCGKVSEEPKKEVKNIMEVSVQTIKDSQSVMQLIEYPAMVVADKEAKIIAKTSGTAKDVNFNVRDKVRIGQELLKIDDINAKSNNTQNFNASQVKQAIIMVEQAASSFNLAQKNYQNLVLSGEKDLHQAQIGVNQSGSGKNNLTKITAENYKSAELAYATAKLNREQAKISLDNKKSTGGQSEVDTITNADTTVDSAFNTSSTIILNINNITNLGGGVTLTYKDVLGALNPLSLSQAMDAYGRAVASKTTYLSQANTNTQDRLSAVLIFANDVKKLTNTTKNLFDNTVASADLPQSSVTGTSLPGLQSIVAGYQSQMTTLISQINAAKQSLTNTKLNNDSTLDSLEKAYELALNQEESAKQNLENLKANSTSQLDSADFGLVTSSNQLDGLKIKLNSQLAVAKSQVEIASLNYNNAVVTLQSLYDSRTAISPIDGIITKKVVADGDTISQGQILAIVSQSENVKLQLYVNQDDLAYLKPDQKVLIKDNENHAYDGIIKSITPQADNFSKRFLVEVKPIKNDLDLYVLGTVMNVAINYSKNTSNAKNIILPLSAIEIGQNGSSIMIVEDNKIKKINVEIVKVEGETAEIKIDLKTTDQIVVEGNKLVQEGDEVKIK